MIRINLLPQGKKAAASAAASPSAQTTLWAVVYLAVALLWCVGLTVIYFVYDGRLEAQVQRNEALNERIDTLEQKSRGLEALQKKLARSKELERIVDQLQDARTGPARMLAELSNILSKSEGPSIDPAKLEQIRRENPLAGYNENWDVQRLWVTSFQENDRDCRITGRGKTNEDVAEFLRRLSLSKLFADITLTKTHMVDDDETGLSLIGFELTCEVRY